MYTKILFDACKNGDLDYIERITKLSHYDVTPHIPRMIYIACINKQMDIASYLHKLPEFRMKGF